jgi:hypothetical protein
VILLEVVPISIQSGPHNLASTRPYKVDQIFLLNLGVARHVEVEDVTLEKIRQVGDVLLHEVLIVISHC